MKALIIILPVFFISHIAFCQDASLKVFDKETKLPIPYANVSFEAIATKVQHFSITSLKGEIISTVSEESQIAISFVGYKTIVDTINPGESKSYYMQPVPKKP